MTEELFEQLISNGIKWSAVYTNSQPIKGGQVCGMPQITRMEHLELGIVIECSLFRSQTENRKVCIEMLKTAIKYTEDLKIVK